METVHAFLPWFLWDSESKPHPDSLLAKCYRAMAAFGSPGSSEDLKHVLKIALEHGTENPVEVDAGYPSKLVCQRWWLDNSQRNALVAVRGARGDESQRVWAILVSDPSFADALRESMGEDVPSSHEWPRGYQVAYLGVGVVTGPYAMWAMLRMGLAQRMMSLIAALTFELGRAVVEEHDDLGSTDH